MKYYLASNEDLKGVYVKYYIFISGSSIQDITVSITSIPNFSSFPGWRAWEEPKPSTRSEPAEATAVGLSQPGDWEAQTEGKNILSQSLSSCPSSISNILYKLNATSIVICANHIQPQLLFLQIIFSPKCKVGLGMGSRAELQKCKSAKSSGWMVMPKKQSPACIIRLLGQPLVQCSRQRHAVRLCPKQKGSVEGQLERLWVQPLPLSAWPHIVLYCGTHLDNGLGDKGGWAEPS